MKRQNISWEQRKLGEIGNIITGSTPSTEHTEYYSETGIPWVTPTDITDSIITETLKRLSVEGEKIGRIVPAGTILVTCIASIGKNAMLAVKGSFNQQINGLVANRQEYDTYFLLAESVNWSMRMKAEAAAGTMQIVNKHEFSSIVANIPELREQSRIGDCYRRINSLLSLHHRQCLTLAFHRIRRFFHGSIYPGGGF